MALSNDTQWSAATGSNLHDADEALERLERHLIDQAEDEETARVVRDVGAVFVGCAAAVCSAVADLAAAVRDRPS